MVNFENLHKNKRFGHSKVLISMYNNVGTAIAIDLDIRVCMGCMGVMVDGFYNRK
jgi:hypothetical protein